MWVFFVSSKSGLSCTFLNAVLYVVSVIKGTSLYQGLNFVKIHKLNFVKIFLGSFLQTVYMLII